MTSKATDTAVSDKAMHIEGLQVSIEGKSILSDVTLTVKPGEVHAIMGPNGAGKSTLSHVLMGKPGYKEEAGTFTVDGVDMLSIPTWKRARAGLFLGMQYPTEVPGVTVQDMLAASLEKQSAGEIQANLEKQAAEIGFDKKFLERPLNVDLSGGERKRNETVQLSVLEPKYAILDELDSGLDIDALREVSKKVQTLAREKNLGVLLITHYSRLFQELKPDQVHVLAQGKIVKSGDSSLAEELEKSGYAEYV